MRYSRSLGVPLGGPGTGIPTKQKGSGSMTWKQERKRVWALVLDLQRRIKTLEEENKGQEQPAKPVCLDMEKG